MNTDHEEAILLLHGFTLAPSPTDEAIASIEGQPLKTVLNALLVNGEHRYVVDQFNRVPVLEKTVEELQKELAAANTRIKELSSQPTQTVAPEVTNLYNAVIAAVKKGSV